MQPSTPTETKPLILVTNDDGIQSPGLWAAVQAVLPLGDILVVAPAHQWSGAGRSMPSNVTGQVSPYTLEVDGRDIPAYQVDGSPAMVVTRGILELTPRQPALLVAGINYGENLGSDVTISGTIGAALQGAVSGIPALAVSLQTPKETHINPSDAVDFGPAIHFARTFARWMLNTPLPFDLDILKVDLPADATINTPWRLTRASRFPYFVTDHSHLPTPESLWQNLGYDPLPHPEQTEPDSDIYALAVDRVISVTPLSLDLTARVDPGQVEALLRGPKH